MVTAAHLTLMLRILAATLALSACAYTPAPTVGRLYHYVRSNQDGTEPEHIYQYRASATFVEVGKMVSNCTNAAYVTAELDPVTSNPRELVGGRLDRRLGQEAFAWLSYKQGPRRLSARIPSADLNVDVILTGNPWMLYDFDLTDLNARFAGHPAPRTDLRIDVALIWPEEGVASPFRDLGWATIHFLRSERHNNRRAFRYDVSGALNGPLWLDAAEGHILEARFFEPNHAEYENFRLVLQSVEDDGAASWREARAAHWRGCP